MRGRQQLIRYYPPVGLSQLFRSLEKGKRPTLDLKYSLDKDHVLRFSAREALGIPEQTLLLAILSLAGEQYAAMGDDAVLRDSDARDLPGRLWAKLYPGGDVCERQALRVETTWDELSRRCGKVAGGTRNSAQKESMRRLCEVIVWEEKLQRQTSQQSFLVVWLVGNDKHIHLAVNHRLASAFFVGGQYARVMLNERLALNNDATKCIHAFLSTCISSGHQLVLGLPKLTERVWSTHHESLPEGTIRRRKCAMITALQAIGRLPNWSVVFERNGLVTVYRSKTDVRKMPSISGARKDKKRTAQVEEEVFAETELLWPDVSGLFGRA